MGTSPPATSRRHLSSISTKITPDISRKLMEIRGESTIDIIKMAIALAIWMILYILLSVLYFQVIHAKKVRTITFNKLCYEALNAVEEDEDESGVIIIP